MDNIARQSKRMINQDFAALRKEPPAGGTGGSMCVATREPLSKTDQYGEN